MSVSPTVYLSTIYIYRSKAKRRTNWGTRCTYESGPERVVGGVLELRLGGGDRLLLRATPLVVGDGRSVEGAGARGDVGAGGGHHVLRLVDGEGCAGGLLDVHGFGHHDGLDGNRLDDLSGADHLGDEAAVAVHVVLDGAHGAVGLHQTVLALRLVAVAGLLVRVDVLVLFVVHRVLEGVPRRCQLLVGHDGLVDGLVVLRPAPGCGHHHKTQGELQELIVF
jgi:hypothetical protein